MAEQTVYEGTLDEIYARYGSELNGRRVKVTIDEPATSETAGSFYETATPEEWSKEWREFTESHSRNLPLLTDEAISRDSIYEGRG